MRKIAKQDKKALIPIPNNTPDPEPTLNYTKSELEFAESSASGVGFDKNLKGYKNSKITTDEVNRYLEDPTKNYKQLQALSKYFKTNSGLYSQVLEYFYLLPKYYFLTIPRCKTESLRKGKSKVEKVAYESAYRAEILNITDNCKRFAEDLWTYGECFYYKYESKDNIFYQKLPNEICEPWFIENGILRFAVDISMLKGEDPLLYPPTIGNAITLFNKNSKNAIFQEGRYFVLGDEGVGFSLVKGGHAIPPLSSTFSELVNTDEKKALQKKVDKINNTKMIHSKIPLDKDGKPIMDFTVAGKYIGVIKSYIEKLGLEGMFAIANPFETETLNLDSKSNQNANSLAKEALEQFYNELGTSEMLFNSAKGGAEALKKSALLDSARSLGKTLTMFQDYFSYEVGNAKGNVKYKIKLLEVTIFNEAEKAKESSQWLTSGGSVKYHYANMGFTPLEMINLIEEENILGIKDKLTPIMTSHTQSGKESKSKGRMDSDEMQSAGEEVSETTQAKKDSGGDVG